MSSACLQDKGIAHVSVEWQLDQVSAQGLFLDGLLQRKDILERLKKGTFKIILSSFLHALDPADIHHSQHQGPPHSPRHTRSLASSSPSLLKMKFTSLLSAAVFGSLCLATSSSALPSDLLARDVQVTPASSALLARGAAASMYERAASQVSGLKQSPSDSSRRTDASRFTDCNRPHHCSG